MWHWDQGRLAYFQFDALRRIASFVVSNNFKIATKEQLSTMTGLPFAAPITHSPWRNYSRILKLCLLVSEQNGIAQATPVAGILSQPGLVTCDEYFHFLLSAFTEPAPALENWRPDTQFRFPLLFSLKYLLAKASVSSMPIATLSEIVGAYKNSGFIGDETDTDFISIIHLVKEHIETGQNVDKSLLRQAQESLRVIAQISYLHVRRDQLIISLNAADAQEIFQDLSPVSGLRAPDREAEIRRLADLFRGGSTNDFFDYPNTTISEVEESGFSEGNKVKKTHVIIERNVSLRREFFLARPSTICDVCMLDTQKTYPWTERVMDIHHLLPLSSGTRVEARGTTFDDLVPVCPSCHRAIHRFYDSWLKKNGGKDFASRDEARAVYSEMKSQFPGLIC